MLSPVQSAQPSHERVVHCTLYIETITAVLVRNNPFHAEKQATTSFAPYTHTPWAADSINVPPSKTKFRFVVGKRY